MYKLKFTILQLEIIRFLSINTGKSFNARSLANHLDVSQTAISKSLPLLEKEQFIKLNKDNESGRWSIELNRSNNKVIGYKRSENLRILYESGLVDFLKEKFPESRIILYGLYSKGEDTFQSPLNIAIGSKEKKLDLREFYTNLERDIDIKFYDPKKIKNETSDGMLLSGGINL